MVNKLPCKTCIILPICKSEKRVGYVKGIITGYCSILYDYLFKRISKQRRRKRHRQVVSFFNLKDKQ